MRVILIIISISLIILSIGALFISNEKIACGVTFNGKDFSNYPFDFLIESIDKKTSEINSNKITLKYQNKEIQFLFTSLFNVTTTPKKLGKYTSKNIPYFIKNLLSPNKININIILNEKIDKIKDAIFQLNKLVEIKPISSQKIFYKGYTKLTREKNGKKLNISHSITKIIEKAKRSYNNNEPIIIELETETFKPKITRENLKKDLGCIYSSGEYVTEFDKNNILRTINLKKAVSSIDGIIVEPYDIFSFNKILGARTKKNGYEKASVILRGRIVDDFGGGICQVSSTLYNSVLSSGLKIKERYNHSIVFPHFYVPIGLDAAVAWGYKDFRFYNNTKGNIMIEAEIVDNVVICKIYLSTKTTDRIELISSILKKYPAKIIKKKTSKLKKGVEKIDRIPVDGYSAISYRKIYKNNKLIKNEKLSKDNYQKYNGITLIGR